MPTLTSRFFTQTNVRDRLSRCLNDHAFNIKLGDQGDHVAAIQEALFLLDKLKIDNHELGQARYGPSTAEAVFAFKKNRTIINYSYQQSVDRIVGKMTMESLDLEMSKFENGGGDKPAAVRTQDIVIHIVGQDPSNASLAGRQTTGGQPFVGIAPVSVFNKDVQDGEYLKRHFELIHKQWNGGLPKFGTDPTPEIVRTVESEIERTKNSKQALGRIILIGTSIGGRNVVSVASALTVKGIPLTYVAAADAAFTDQNDPTRSLSVKASSSENFFQSLTNGKDDEFHGSVGSFKRNQDFAAEPLFQNMAKSATLDRKTMDLLHKMAVVEGYSRARTTALSILRS